MPMDKEILKQYIDACEQVKEAKEDVLRLKKNRKIKGATTAWLFSFTQNRRIGGDEHGQSAGSEN